MFLTTRGIGKKTRQWKSHVQVTFVLYIYCILCTFNTSSKVQRYVTNIVCTFVVRPLGCWVNVLGDSAIPENHGDLGVQGCYEKVKNLSNRIFAVQKGQCLTTSDAKNRYKKYGPVNLGAFGWNYCSVNGTGGAYSQDVYELENGNSIRSYKCVNIIL